MFKKIIALLAVFCLLFSVSVLAEEAFLEYGKDNKAIAKVLNLTEKELENYCKQNKITYFAINKDNTKQIKRTEFIDKFSQKAVDLSVLSDKEILELSGEISGFSGVKGKIVNLNSTKLLKLYLESEDDGGKYHLTQYITVKDAKKITLTFCTAKGEDEGYIEEVLNKQFPKKTDYTPIVLIGIVVFAVIGIVATIFIIKDFKRKE